MEISVIVCLLVILLAIWIVSVRKKLAIMDENINHSMNQIGVQISSRFDALFAVLDLMKGYAADEPGKYKQKKPGFQGEHHKRLSDGCSRRGLLGLFRLLRTVPFCGERRSGTVAGNAAPGDRRHLFDYQRIYFKRKG